MKKILPLLTLIGFLLPHWVEAKDLKASLAELPVHAEIDELDGRIKGGFVELVKAMDEVYSKGDIAIELFPFPRSLLNVQTEKADFHIPLIKQPHISTDSLPFAYSSEKITQVTFVLYTKADRPTIYKHRLSAHNIETQRGHKELFTFKVGEVKDIRQGIDKVSMGRIDGFIMEQDAVDAYIRKNKIKNISRSLYAVFDSHIVIPKGQHQEEIDDIVSSALRALKDSGRLDEINATIHQPYEDWQPYNMDW